MRSITIKKIKEINEKCKNGFRFDTEHFRMTGDKHLSKCIKIAEDKVIKATLYFREEIKGYQETGNSIPVLNVSVFTKSKESVLWSSGLGKFHSFHQNKVKRKNLSVLIDLTQEITDEMISELAVDNCNESIYNSH